MQASLEVRALPASQLAPPAPRPKSTAAVASRLIGSALGIRGLVCAALLPTCPARQSCGGALILTCSVGCGRDFARHVAHSIPKARCFESAAICNAPLNTPHRTGAKPNRSINFILFQRLCRASDCVQRDKAGEADLAAARKQQADTRRQRAACLAAAWDDL